MCKKYLFFALTPLFVILFSFIFLFLTEKNSDLCYDICYSKPVLELDDSVKQKESVVQKKNDILSLTKEELDKHKIITYAETIYQSVTQELNANIRFSEECGTDKKKILYNLLIDTRKYFDEKIGMRSYYMYGIIKKNKTGTNYELEIESVKIICILEFRPNEDWGKDLYHLHAEDFLKKHFKKGVINSGFIFKGKFDNKWLLFGKEQYPDLKKLEKELKKMFRFVGKIYA